MRNRPHWIPALLIGAVGIAGCSPVDAAGDDAGQDDDSVTYYDDIRPILAAHCVGCHTAGGIAPFPLRTYDDVRTVAERVALETRERRMPPFLADGSGTCNEYDDAGRRLDDEEIDLIQRWVAEGSLMGDPSTPAPPERTLPTLERVDHTLAMPEAYAPTATSVDDDYRCFVIEPGFTGAPYLTGYDVRPGDASLVHHVVVYQPVSAAIGEEARGRDAFEDGPGYTCFGDAGVLALPVMLWAPGVGATRYPETTGIQLHADRPLIMQVHYNLIGAAGGTDQTEIDLTLEESVAHPAHMSLIADFDIELPPVRPEVVTEAEVSLVFAPPSDGPWRVWGVAPHMHTLGRKLRVDVTGEGGQCLVDVPRWDFDWQNIFFYRTPLTLTGDELFDIRCTYDTRGRTEHVYWGDSTSDEMCLAFVYLSD